MAGNGKRYEPVSSRVDFPRLETSVLESWRESDLFHEVDRARADAPLFVFYEGPPTANGSPGIHHVLSRSFKDVVLRYKTMRGFRPLRRGGWDTHGLPVELEIEKELGISSKQEIEAFGIEEFNRRCRESVFRYVGEWEAMTERAGVWLDVADAYVTYHNSYIESAWWVFKRLWEKGLVYEGYKVTPHCPRCVTSLSSHEVALGYQEDTPDPSIYVRFPVSESQSMSYGASPDVLAALGCDGGRWTAPRPAFIAWTTTPWTLTANCALAVGPDVAYVLSENDDGERAIVAEALAASVLGDGWREVARCAGADLAGIEYDAPYSKYNAPSGTFLARHGHAHRVLPADFVSTADGTGIVHSAVAYGAEDAELGRAHGIETVHTVDVHGVLAEGFPGGGTFVKDADKQLVRDLDERGLLFRDASPYKHTYPFCWRCGTPLLYYAKTSWYIRTTAMKDEMLAGNRGIEWVPEHIKEGRFGEWLRNNVDWSVSRERYWGTPIPIWRCDRDPQHLLVAGSTADLAERVTDETRGLLDGLDLHRPYVDRVELRCEEPGCGGTMRRVPEVADAWYDSGAMPFAQWDYPVTVKGPGGEDVTLNGVDDLIASPLFPADYITEAVDQTRGWFYSLLALSTLIAGKPSYESCLVLGLILDGKGEKMSKSKGNVVDPWAGDERARRGRPALVPLHRRARGRRAALLTGPREGDAPPVPAHALEHLQLLRHLRQHRRLRPGRPRRVLEGRTRRRADARRAPAQRARPLDRLRAERPRREGRGRHGRAQRHLGGTPHPGLRQPPLQLVRPPQPPPLLEGRERRRQDLGLRHPLLLPPHPHEAHRPHDPLRRRRHLPQPRPCPTIRSRPVPAQPSVVPAQSFPRSRPSFPRRQEPRLTPPASTSNPSPTPTPPSPTSASTARCASRCASPASGATRAAGAASRCASPSPACSSAPVPGTRSSCLSSSRRCSTN